MIIEKPSWVRHDGAIFSMDLQPAGQRCATAGADHKVKIWNSEPMFQEEMDAMASKLLATLCEHCAGVNCVRWSKSGIYLASGSDDRLLFIYERRPGAGTVEFGVCEPANVENWKMMSTLRAHTADVVDLAWSPDDTMLASCSLDRTVRIWQVPGGILLRTLEDHTSLVKGVAWDPIGSFLASQSDDKTVMIWQTSNWAPIHKAEGSWKKSVGSTFFRRLSWSPCGHYIITTHGFQKPRHTAQVLERGDWSAAFNFVGHNAPVVAVRVNHSMFRKELPGDELVDAKSDVTPYNVVAVGSQDCNLTVWSTSNPRPVFVGKHFFTQSIVDLTWSQDGYSLFCCSLDGTIATFQFGSHELGFKVPDEELEEIKRNRYGDRGRQAALAESPAQLLLEAAAAAKQNNDRALVLAPPPPSAEPENILVAPPPVRQKPDPTPVKQKEYLRKDGRRRIIPEALPSEDGGAHAGDKRKPASDMQNNVPAKRPARGAEVNVGPGSASTIDVVGPSNMKNIDGVLSKEVRVPDEFAWEMNTPPMCLEAKKIPESGETELICSQGGEIKWRDRFAGKVTALTGNPNFWAVGCEDGSLQIYTMAGRRAFPSLFVGSPAAFMDCNASWDLLLLTRGGTMHVWDLQQPACTLNESLFPLLSSASGAAASKESGVMKIQTARFSKSGFPLVVLANGHAFLFHMKMRSWMRIADDNFPGSSFASTLPPSYHDGELSALQKNAANIGRATFSWSKAVVNEKFQTRAHLEDLMASALALNSADEYRQHLVSYTRFLTKEADEVRLREICDELLGPLHAPEGNDASGRPSWEPCLAGLKKRELLRCEVLPAMAANRGIQRLVNEYIDLLSEYDIDQPVVGGQSNRDHQETNHVESSREDVRVEIRRDEEIRAPQKEKSVEIRPVHEEEKGHEEQERQQEQQMGAEVLPQNQNHEVPVTDQ